MEESYIKCTGCNTCFGVFITDKQPMNIFCGTCNKITEFITILKEEFETDNYIEGDIE